MLVCYPWPRSAVSIHVPSVLASPRTNQPCVRCASSCAASCGSLQRLIDSPTEGNAWHADHIVAVHEGGGENTPLKRTLPPLVYQIIWYTQRRARLPSSVQMIVVPGLPVLAAVSTVLAAFIITVASMVVSVQASARWPT